VVSVLLRVATLPVSYSCRIPSSAVQRESNETTVRAFPAGDDDTEPPVKESVPVFALARTVFTVYFDVLSPCLQFREEGVVQGSSTKNT
jgi:hypothetical protein